MLVYPQLTTGTLAQYPVEKHRRARTVAARAPDGTLWKLADPLGNRTEWRLSYSDLTDEEAGALEQFFVTVEGSLGRFTFADPFGNLFAASDHLTNAVWSRGPLLTLASVESDPAGGNAAYRASNAGTAPQSIKQSLAVPPEYVYCLSMYVRSSTGASVTMILGPHRAERGTTASWRRIVLTNMGGTVEAPVDFGLEFPAGVIVEVFGMQVEAQPAPSAYKATIAGGVYEDVRIRDDSFQIGTTGPDRNSCTVNIIHDQHL